MTVSLQKEMEGRKRGDLERQWLVQQLSLTQEEERRRIARKMHDFAQQLALHQIELEMLRRNPPPDPAQVGARLDALGRQVSKRTPGVRDLSRANRSEQVIRSPAIGERRLKNIVRTQVATPTRLA